jgi:hypothetical protein
MSFYLFEKFAKPTNRNETSLSPVGEWAQYFRAHPDELPKNAPDPDLDPAGFATYCKHNLPRIIRMSGENATEN